MSKNQNSPKIPTGQSSMAATSFRNNPETGTIAPSNTPIPEEFTNDAIKSLQQNNREMKEYIQNGLSSVPHPEAVTATNNIIISVLTKIKEVVAKKEEEKEEEKKGFSADNIEEAIENAGAKDYEKLNHPKNNEVKDPSSAEDAAHANGGSVHEKYDKNFHGGAYGEKADSDFYTIYGRDLGKYGCLPGAFRGNERTQTKENTSKLENIGLPKEKPEEYQPNNWPQEINELMNFLNINKALLNGIEKIPPKDWKILPNTPEVTVVEYKDMYSKNEVNFFKQKLKETINAQEATVNNLKTTYLKTKINPSANADVIIEQYGNQLIREYEQFSGDITIEKLKPGTVLVRDFGQGQSVKSSCWCLAANLNSAVNCDKDLQTQLAVKPCWNGGGNRAVFIVPKEPPIIYVAVGKIAQQRNDSDYEETVYHPGGGIQYNILTPNNCDVNNVKNTSGGFANAGKAFDKCCFVITNTGIIEKNDRKTVQANQAQIQQPNPVATNGSKLQQND